MSSQQWYHAQLRWAVMVEGKEGLRAWKEAVHIFQSEDQETAFQQARERYVKCRCFRACVPLEAVSTGPVAS
jgi:hypothetical protein